MIFIWIPGSRLVKEPNIYLLPTSPLTAGKSQVQVIFQSLLVGSQHLFHGKMSRPITSPNQKPYHGFGVRVATVLYFAYISSI